MRTQVIIPAAGSGVRLNSPTPKPLILLKGKEIIVYSLEVFDQCSMVEGIIVVAPAQHCADFEAVIKKYSFKKPVKVIPGGATRSESVFNGVKATDPNVDYILVHDAARPLVSLKLVEDSIRACEMSKAIVVAVPVKSTIKRTDHNSKDINATLDRNILWEAQTPQVFAYELLNQAHQRGIGLEATDDAFLVERYGAKVKIFEGEYRNIKITTPEDLKIAEVFLE
ncbi:MAG: 2-C-methyl-D-erythritol 4-phosphate cytidylyltransferase [Candidatus Omnitrophica bacterium]|nr:2-C-methyl-D-erythritol 4-phosphate cytidylyltransferase [Candidatus Omnitrophota bacterium]